MINNTTHPFAMSRFYSEEDDMSEITDDHSYRRKIERTEKLRSSNEINIGSKNTVSSADGLLLDKANRNLTEIAKARILHQKFQANSTNDKNLCPSDPIEVPEKKPSATAVKYDKDAAKASPDINERQQSDVIARRCMEAFVEEMKEFGREGGFQNCTEMERKALNDILAQRYLGSLVSLPGTPIVSKVRKIISNFINGKCRQVEFYIHEQIKDESPREADFWKCAVCGKQNREGKKIQRLCITCGRGKGYSGSKKIQKLNECCGIDATPLTTASSKEELVKAEDIENKRERWDGEEGKRLIFVSKQIDYEALSRNELKNEIKSVLESIERSMDTEQCIDKVKA